MAAAASAAAEATDVVGIVVVVDNVEIEVNDDTNGWWRMGFWGGPVLLLLVDDGENGNHCDNRHGRPIHL